MKAELPCLTILMNPFLTFYYTYREIKQHLRSGVGSGDGCGVALNKGMNGNKNVYEFHREDNLYLYDQFNKTIMVETNMNNLRWRVGSGVGSGDGCGVALMKYEWEQEYMWV